MPLSLTDASEKVDRLAAIAVRDHNANKLDEDKFNNGMQDLVKKQNELKAFQERFSKAGMLDEDGKFLQDKEWNEEQNSLLEEYEEFVSEAKLDQEADAQADSKHNPKSVSEAFAGIFTVPPAEEQLTQEQLDEGKAALGAASAQPNQTATQQAVTKPTPAPTAAPSKEMTKEQEATIAEKAHAVMQFTTILMDVSVKVATLGIIDTPFNKMYNGLVDSVNAVHGAFKALKSVFQSSESSAEDKQQAVTKLDKSLDSVSQQAHSASEAIEHEPNLSQAEKTDMQNSLDSLSNKADSIKDDLKNAVNNDTKQQLSPSSHDSNTAPTIRSR